MQLRYASCLFAACLFASSIAHAAGECFVLYGHDGWVSNAPDHPAAKGLQRFAAKREELHSLAFTPSDDWVILFGGNGVWASNTELPAVKKLIELQQGHTLKCVAFAPHGAWTIFWDQNGNWSSGVPDDAFKRIVEVTQAGGRLRSISYGPRGEWVLLFDESGVYYGGVPDDLAQVLNDAAKNRNPVRCVNFTNRGTWICVTDNGWWTSDLGHPASKQIARLLHERKAVKWVAVAPELTDHDFQKWAQVIERECGDKLSGGYGFEVQHRGQVVASGTNGWARAPWEKEHPSVRWTLEKPMGVASVSKTITAVALLKLWEETGHRFSLDDSFWPHIKRICPEAHDDVKQVTIRQLLRQRSGFKKHNDCQSPKQLEELLREPLAHKPGTTYAYQNNNFYIARLVLEEIGHVSYTPYVKDHVLKPAGITRMETHAESHQPMCGYAKPGDHALGYPYEWQCDSSAGPAGWYASVSDLGRFLNGLRDNRVLSAETIKIMYQGDLGWDNSQPGWEKNGGWFWDEPPRHGNLHSVIAHFPDDVDAVILANCDLPKDIVALVFQAWRESMEP